MHWHDIVAWILQVVGMSSAAWGLYSSETSKVDEHSGHRRLTRRGRVAFAAVLSGAVGLGVSQWRDVRRSATAAQERKEALDRANRAEQTLSEVRLDQQRQTASLTEQLETQERQLAFLRHLSLVQQELKGLELSWDAPQAMTRHMQSAVRQAIQQERDANRWTPAGDDVYFDPCVLHGEITATRRPNYTWRIECRIARPQGMRGVVFDLQVGDPKGVIFDRFLDAVMSPHFAMATAEGEDIVAVTMANRPMRVKRLANRYTLTVDPLGARFSSLQDADVRFRMDFQDVGLGPTDVRIRSLDPLAVFDQVLTLRWSMRTVEVVKMVLDVGDMEAVDVERKAAFSNPIRLRSNFDRLLTPKESPRPAPL